MQRDHLLGSGRSRAPWCLGVVVATAIAASTIPLEVVSAGAASPPPNGAFSGVSCASSTSCTAVGSSHDASAVQVTLVATMHEDRWEIAPTPNPAGARASRLTAVSCPTTGMCMAVGSSVDGAGRTASLALEWSGTAWAVVPTPLPTGAAGSTLSAVACSGTRSCVAVGDESDGAGTPAALIEEWNGNSWTLTSAPHLPQATLSRLNGVACPGAGACTAVGSVHTPSGGTRTLVESWDGTSWLSVPSAHPDGATESVLSGVGCPTAADCVAAGQFVSAARTRTPLAEASTGAGWTVEATALQPQTKGSTFAGVACPTAGTCLAVGQSSTSAGEVVPVVEERRNGRWAALATPGTAGSAASMAAVACPGPDDCLAVGRSHRAGVNRTLAEHWNGATWTVLETPNA